MLAGHYPSDDFAELRPRITWDRLHGHAAAREGARRMAVTNGGTIPDRGLYGVFLAGAAAPGGGARVGELDEEMVFESRVGETFLLGASTWRIEEITHDRVLVSPAPGEPGKMPFWRGDAGPHRRARAHDGRADPRAARPAPQRGPRGAWWTATTWTPGGRQPAAPTCATGRGHRGVPDDRTWSSSAPATSWATGASACSRRSAAGSTRRGPWR